jgi:hypothetical protein
MDYRLGLIRIYQRVLCCALMLLACGSCGGSTTPASQIGGGLNDLPTLLGDPAAQAQLAATTAKTGSAAGAEYSAVLPHNRTAANSSSGLYGPDWTEGGGSGTDGLAYAIYAFDADALTGEQRLYCAWVKYPTLNNYWIGLANQQHQRWDWRTGPINTYINIADIADYKGDTGTVLVAVVLAGTDPAVLAMINLGGSLPQATVPASKLDLEMMGGGGASAPVIVDGAPAFLFVEDAGGGNPNLLYIRAQDEDGSAWNSAVVLSPNTYGYPSLAIVDGNPAVAYSAGYSGSLVYRRANDAQGTSWGDPVVVDGLSENPGQSINLLVADGNPAIAYTTDGSGSTEDRLLYVRADDAQGSAWGIPTTIEPGYGDEVEARDCSMALIEGKPAIAYAFSDLQNNLEGVRYCAAQDVIGLNWNATADVFSQAESVSQIVRNVDLLATCDTRPGVGWFIEDIGGTSTAQIREGKNQAGTEWYNAISYTQHNVPNTALMFAGFSSIRVPDEPGHTLVVAALNLQDTSGNSLVDLFGTWVGDSGVPNSELGSGSMSEMLLKVNESDVAITKATACDSVDFTYLCMQLAMYNILAQLNTDKGGSKEAGDEVEALRAYCLSGGFYFGSGTSHAVFGYVDLTPQMFPSGGDF